MIIEVTGIGYPNKGAELMLSAIVEQIQAEWKKGTIVSTKPTRRKDLGYLTLSRCGCHQKATYKWRGLDVGRIAANLCSSRSLRTFGLIADKEIDVILDSSGLRYSDKWGVNSIEKAICDYQRAKKRGAKIILMPQAFGPFENNEVRRAMVRMHEIVDRIYARDDTSYKFLRELFPISEKIQQAFDFTSLCEGTPPKDWHHFKGKIAIIPNQRMLDKTSEEISARYMNLMVNFSITCEKAGYEIFVLNHEGKSDESLCKALVEKTGSDIYYSGIRSAKEVKGIINLCSGVLTSRFHGLVSALTQGVPAIATSWNHKYEELLKTFDSADCIIDPLASEQQHIEAIKHWLATSIPAISEKRKNIETIAFSQKEQIKEFWIELEKFLS